MVSFRWGRKTPSHYNIGAISPFKGPVSYVCPFRNVMFYRSVVVSFSLTEMADGVIGCWVRPILGAS